LPIGWEGIGMLKRVVVGVAVILVSVAMLAGPAAAGFDESDPANWPSREAYADWKRGYLLHALGRYEAAITMFERSIAIHPTAIGHTFLGWSLSNLNRLEEAIEQCKRAIELDPNYGNPYNDIGVYLLGLDRPDEAIGWLQRALQAKRYCCYEYAHFNLGRVYIVLGDVETAIRSFERALEQNPDHLPSRQFLDIIERHFKRI